MTRSRMEEALAAGVVPAHEAFVAQLKGRRKGKVTEDLSVLDEILAEAAVVATPELAPGVAEIAAAPEELVVEAETGRVRQAGASPAIAGVDQDLVKLFREAAEAHLYLFTKVVLNRSYLTQGLHLPMCQWITDFTRVRRKLLLFPREHAKTSVVSHGMPIHMQIQTAERNVYFPGLEGSETTLILCCETLDRAKDHIRVQLQAWEGNQLLRGLWPKRAWEKPSRDAKLWNAKEYIVPRENDYPDPTVRGLGVDGAITGAHPWALLKDDLISLEAAQSPAVMHGAIRWHVASRALINKPQCLEITIGTRWAIYDLYAAMMKEVGDGKLECWVRSMMEDGKIIYPELFTMKDVGRLQKEFGSLFPLLYMNTAADPSLVDFDVEKLRRFSIVNGAIVFREEMRDAQLRERVETPLIKAEEADPNVRGQKLTAQVWERMRGETKGSTRWRSAA